MTRLRVTTSALVVAYGVGVLAQPRPLTLLVPPFESSSSLGRNVSTVLNLQVWQTLRKAPSPNPLRLSFGDGMVTWSDQPLPSQTHEAAARSARQNDADIVLWGRAFPYGSGAVVQPYLTIVNTPPSATWQVVVSGPGVNSRLEIGLPRLRYEFRALALEGSLVGRYSTPDALRLYSLPTGGEAIGTVGSYFTAERQDGTAARVRSGDTVGWIRLPELSTSRTEVVDFVGGLIRIMRTDWGGAQTLFTRVIGNVQAPTALKSDAYLFRAVALERSGSSGLEDARRAYALNPYDRATVAYLAMAQVAFAIRTPPNSPGRDRVLGEARALLNANRFLFPRDDPWYTRATAVLNGPPLGGRG
jgi:hypothetical protein